MLLHCFWCTSHTLKFCHCKVVLLVSYSTTLGKKFGGQVGKEDRKLLPCAVANNIFIDSKAFLSVSKEPVISFSGIKDFLLVLSSGVCML